MYVCSNRNLRNSHKNKQNVRIEQIILAGILSPSALKGGIFTLYVLLRWQHSESVPAVLLFYSHIPHQSHIVSQIPSPKIQILQIPFNLCSSSTAFTASKISFSVYMEFFDKTTKTLAYIQNTGIISRKKKYLCSG